MFFFASDGTFARYANSSMAGSGVPARRRSVAWRNRRWGRCESPLPAAYFIVQSLSYIRDAQSLALFLRQRHYGYRVFKAGQAGWQLGGRLGEPLIEFR